MLNRFGFGPSTTTLAEVKDVGPDGWFEKQLRAPADEPGDLALRLWSLPVTHLSAWELRDWPEQDVLRQLQMAALIRAVHTPWQVRERMVHFWTDHFNIFGRKGLGAYRKPLDEKSVVRANVLGTFPAMLKASARSTAMLLYLDQQASNAEHPNENYGRELLELHTLGVDGGYTQRDVMEVARCFTGWTEERGFLKKKGSFKFDPSLHDSGEKVVLGRRIPAGGGIEDGEQVLDIVANHPATAAHIAKKLCRWTLGDEGDRLAPKIEKAYTSTRGDIEEMLRQIYQSELWKAGPPVVKRPFDFVVGALRALDATTDGDRPLIEHLASMGQPLYQWPMPDGYPTDTEAWSGSLLARWNFAFALCRGSIKGTSVPMDETKNLAERAFLGAVDANTIKGIQASIEDLSDPRDQLAACLASPEYQWR